ncbi:MAG: hypothetical protein Q9M23_07025 [Mariprofundaceae bacterium]|nr:hypothetical protein [Mariprofundaceae bacterium]
MNNEPAVEKLTLQIEIPPESARRTPNCRYRIEGKCFNAINYLRPWMCTEYCIAKLDEWVRKHESGLSDEQVQERVRQLASYGQ